MQASLLFPYDPLLGFEMFMIELAPGATSESSAHASGVVEHMVVIDGEMELRIDHAGRRFARAKEYVFSLTALTPCATLVMHGYAFMNVIHYLPGAASGD